VSGLDELTRDEVMADWLAGLRSGEHKQTDRGVLTWAPAGAPEHCCLGVACHRLALRGALAAYTPDLDLDEPTSDLDFDVQYGEEGAEGALPLEVAQLLGITIDGGFNPALLSDSTRDEISDSAFDASVRITTLAGVNDTLCWPFERIADLIEEIEHAGAWTEEEGCAP